MKNKIMLILIFLFLILFIFLKFTFSSSNNINLTRVYFSNKMMGNASADCILLENIDSYGNSHFGLVDTGYITDNPDEIINFLKNHNVIPHETSLDFVLISHWHSDHAANIGTIIDNYDIGKIYAQEYDDEWSTNGQRKYYETMVEKAIEKNIEVIGVSYISLIDSSISPKRSNNFKEIVTNADSSKFVAFNEKNVEFDWGSSQIKLFNWELFTKTGERYITGVTNPETNPREKKGENNNSICLLLTQGNKKIFLTGDLNNLDENTDTGQLGDEDRIKDSVGKIDVLKLGHHGFDGSNTESFIDTLNPKYAIITAYFGGANKNTIDYLEEKNIEYLYVSADKDGVVATLTNNEVWLSYESNTSFKIIDGVVYYIPKENKYDNVYEVKKSLKYDDFNIEANNWDELVQIINDNKDEIPYNCNEDSCFLKRLIINLNGTTWNATETIKIDFQQNIVLITDDDITIKKQVQIKDNYVFNVEGNLSIGNNKMPGKIIIDGNGDVFTSTQPLVKVLNGQFNMYKNTKLMNNNVVITKLVNNTSKKIYAVINGTAINSIRSVINIDGGEIINNRAEINLGDNGYVLNNKVTQAFQFGISGIAIYLSNSELNMYLGKISNNTGINNSIVKSKTNGITVAAKGTLYQPCRGGGIYSNNSSKVNLVGGEISNNYFENNSQTYLYNPISEDKITNLTSIYHNIDGSGIAIIGGTLNIGKNFKIANNSATNNVILELGNLSKINNGATVGIAGAQIFINGAKTYINGLIIEPGTLNNNPTITNNSTSSVNATSYGGLINLMKIKEYEISNVELKNSTAYNGGAIYIDRSNGTIENSILSSNMANNRGGAIYITSTSNTMLINTIISDNKAINYGGAIFDSGSTIIIDGENTKIIKNESKHGGGIYLKGNTIIKNGLISDNKAINNGSGTGGGIRLNNGILTLNGGIIQNNIADKSGNNVYPYDIQKVNFEENNNKLFTKIDSNYTFTYEKILSSIQNIKCKDTYGNEIINKNEVIGSGFKVIMNDKEYSLIIYGDVDSNGIVNIADAKKIAEHIIDKTILSNDYLLAADYNVDNSIKINDIIEMIKNIQK